MSAEPTLTAEGFYKMLVRRADGSTRQETPWFPNLILDAGLDRYLSNGDIVGTSGTFKVGTNSTAPAVSQTQLLSQVASSGSNAPSLGAIRTTAGSSSPWWGGVIYGGRFDAGSLAGQALTEVGIGWTSTACFSRALIKPDGVNVGAITVLADETLEVYYELRVYPAAADATGNVTLGGINYSFTIRPSQVSLSSGFCLAQALSSNVFGSTDYPAAGFSSATLGAADAAPNGNSNTGNGYATSSVPQTYTNGSFSRVLQVTWGLDRLNTPSGDIQAIQYYLGKIGAYQVVFSPPIPKGSTKTLRLDFTTTLARRP